MAGQSLPVLPALDGLIRLRAGASYAVDAASLGMALAAGVSVAGEWVGFVGWDDFGVEAAAQIGIDLSRTVLVPSPGEHWLEVVAALADVLRVVVLRPRGQVDAKSASIIDARLRARSAVLVVHGAWPRCEASLRTEEVSWDGLGRGSGRLRGQRARVTVSDAGRPTSRDLLVPYGQATPGAAGASGAPVAS